MPLLLDLLRHGMAEPLHELGDFHRPLTADGERAIQRLAGQLAARAERPERVFSSPLRRAWQTALLVSREWGMPRPVEELPALEPDRDPLEVLRALSALGIDDGHVLLVSHQPLVGRLVTSLTGVSNARIAPGTLTRVHCADGPGSRGRLILSLDAPL